MMLSLAVLLLAVESHAGEPINPSSEVPKEEPLKEFVFEGGDLGDFVGALGKTYGVDLFKIATIPEYMRSVRVPKMRVKSRNFQNALVLYNVTSVESGGTMGKWIIRFMNENGTVMNYTSSRMPDVLFLAGKDDDRHVKHLSVKAFAFKGLTEKGLNALHDVIGAEAAMLEHQLRRSGNAGGLEIDGNIRYHKNAGILIASGGDQYVEMASSIIEAFRQAHGPEFNDVPEDATSSKK
jgi:hypothetical protein